MTNSKSGRDNLHFAATKLNQHSSRSHCIFSIKIVRVADPDAPHLARVSIFSFCDLAGSERISKTNNVGERQKETGNINTSLLILGRCIKAMRHNQNCKDKKGLEIVPFRESKLTRLFKSYLTGRMRNGIFQNCFRTLGWLKTKQGGEPVSVGNYTWIGSQSSKIEKLPLHKDM